MNINILKLKDNQRLIIAVCCIFVRLLLLALMTYILRGLFHDIIYGVPVLNEPEIWIRAKDVRSFVTAAKIALPTTLCYVAGDIMDRLKGSEIGRKLYQVTIVVMLMATAATYYAVFALKTYSPVMFYGWIYVMFLGYIVDDAITAMSLYRKTKASLLRKEDDHL